MNPWTSSFTVFSDVFFRGLKKGRISADRERVKKRKVTITLLPKGSKVYFLEE
jgi:hypothetical protein